MLVDACKGMLPARDVHRIAGMPEYAADKSATTMSHFQVHVVETSGAP